MKITSRIRSRLGPVTLAIAQLSIGVPPARAADADDQSHATTSPIKHVIVIIGENRSFDHVFATYKPENGQKVWNLLSEGIVKSDGTPGPNFYKAQQQTASDPGGDAFLISPSKAPY
jgi:phospholipase C